METFYQHIYFIESKESLKIIKKYNISINRLFDEEKQTKGINLLLCSTLRELEKIKFYDSFFLYLESLRFFSYCCLNQYFYNQAFNTYYYSILNFFHNNNLLLFKKNYREYKSFKKKNPIMKIYFNVYNVHYTMRYNSFKDLVSDFGRYKTDKIVQYIKKDKQKIYSIEEILNVV